MAETHVLSALKEKRAELSGELIAAEKRIAQLRADLEHLDGTIRVFDPSVAAAKIRPIHRRKKPTMFPRGECSRAVMTVLRQAAEPLTPREIAERLATQYRLDTSVPAMNELVNKVRNTVARQKPDVLVREKREDTAVWRVAE